MNLSKLFEMQRKLDERIEQEHPRKPGEDRLAKKILALLVELGELANEARFFKFWSNDQKPRMEKEVFCTVCDGTGTPLGIPEESGVDCYQCDGAGFYFINPLLEEYVDCLHFILSIGYDITGILRDDEVEEILSDAKESPGDITDTFIVLYVNAAYLKFKREKDYKDLLTIFLSLGFELGFTPEQIEQAYLQKNAENHRRQAEGY